MPQVCLPFATNAKGEHGRQRRWRAVWATIDKVCVKVERKGRDCSRGGGETTEVCLAHIGVRVHDASMGQDAGVGAGAAFPDGDGVSTGCWATEFRFPRRQSSANERAWWAVIIAGVPPVQRVW